MDGLLLEALYSKYRAEKDDAVARINIYLTNSVGIGEHPQHIEEMDSIVEQYATAEDKLQSLNKIVLSISHANNVKPELKKQLND
jgi:hypothetical protein